MMNSSLDMLRAYVERSSLGFAAHVRRALPSARHLELECGHVPQIERPRQVNAAIVDFLRAVSVADDAPRPARGAVGMT